MKPKPFFEMIPTPLEILTRIVPTDPLGLNQLIQQTDYLLKQAAIEIGCTLHSAQIANNPNLVRTLQIEFLKKVAIENLDRQDKACGHETDLSIKLSDGRRAIQITPYSVLVEMQKLDPSTNIDIHAVKRHLEAEFAVGDLEKSSDGKAYIYNGFWNKLAPVN